MLDEKNANYMGLEKIKAKGKSEESPKHGNKQKRGLSNSQRLNKD